MAVTEASKKAAALKEQALADAAAAKISETASENAAGTVEYKNATTVNIFTDAGKVAPDCTVFLTEDQASNHKGLELCQTRDSE